MALLFTGDNFLYRVGFLHSSSLPITLACRINFQSIVTAQEAVNFTFKFENNTGLAIGARDDGTGTFRARIRAALESGSVDYYAFGPQIQANKWYSLVGRISENSLIDIAVNGIFGTPTQGSGTLSGILRDHGIGALVDQTPSNRCNAAIEDVAVWTGYLSDSEVEQYANGYSPLKLQRHNLQLWSPLSDDSYIDYLRNQKFEVDGPPPQVFNDTGPNLILPGGVNYMNSIPSSEGIIIPDERVVAVGRDNRIISVGA